MYFVSNNSSKSRAEYMDKFKKLEIEAYEVRTRGAGGARFVNFVPHQHFSDSARVLQHCLNTVNLHRYHLSSVGSVHQHHSFHQTGKPTFSLDSINQD